MLRSLPPRTVPLEDLVGYGHIGLLEARERFDPRRGVPFERYARHRVRGAIYDGLRRLGLMRRRAYEDLRRRVLGHRIVGEPTPEGADGPDRTEDARAAYNAIARIATAFLADAALHGERPPSPERSLSQQQDLRRVRAAMDELDEDDRALLRAVYDLEDEGDTAAALARRRGVARSSVTRRHRTVLDKLRRILLERGDPP